MREEDRTSQFSRIKQRPPAIDLSGGKASAESLTPRRNNLAVADAVDFQGVVEVPKSPEVGSALSKSVSTLVVPGLCFFPVNGSFDFFFSLENRSLMSVLVLGRRRWLCNGGRLDTYTSAGLVRTQKKGRGYDLAYHHDSVGQLY